MWPTPSVSCLVKKAETMVWYWKLMEVQTHETLPYTQSQVQVKCVQRNELNIFVDIRRS